MGGTETILEAAVDRGGRLWTAEQLEAQIVTLLRQVGQLENRNADLEMGLEAASGKCYWRVTGYCDLTCGSRAFCDASGLVAFDWSKLKGQA